MLAGCGKRHRRAARGTPSHRRSPIDGRRSPGDAVAFRFVDHAGEATDVPPLAEAWRALAYPASWPTPTGGLRGDDVLRVIELALADADVASYGTPHPLAPAQARRCRFDPVWNRTRAVYESKRSLFTAGDTRYTFACRRARGELQVSLAVPPGGGAVSSP